MRASVSPRSSVLVALAVAVSVGGTVIARRRGYAVGGRTIVRCRQGHLFTTVWIPGVSLKAIRLGWLRYQHCPVGHHWTFVSPVRASDLTDADRAAAAVLDTSVP
ncbi:hypothetical protein Ga0074812_11438 [Parafrankia irregularis]|uniref:Uncharacterized protein n=1 Tax=Parafrankia irregularis TaxID=795642 RepID=A0A0S4QPT9_9ACTN|nr:hypothetical protein Ga0074812_11438 [Parafrankia irregularis]